ncbi:MAG: hypothetical protein AAF468_18650 [Pseudomonadota bacterium]
MTAIDAGRAGSPPSGLLNGGPLAWRRAWLEIDQNESAIHFVATLPGALTVLAAFVAVAALSLQLSISHLGLIAITLFAIIVAPKYRMPIIVGASLFYLFIRPFRIAEWPELLRDLAGQSVIPLSAGQSFWALQLTSVLAFVMVAYGFLTWQKHNKDRTAAKRPVLTLMLGWFALFAVAVTQAQGTIAHAALWSFLGVSISGLWFLAYAAIDNKSKDPTPRAYRAGFLRPFWGGSAIPFGKSFGYLNKFAAKSDEDLAVTRLKALKLAIWALLLTALWKGLEWALYGQLGIDPLQSAILAHAGGEAAPVLGNWASVFSNYFLDLVIIAVWGHFIVATIRMAGWRIPRNTVNPLAARSIAEFWNRYFFYFKELLVDLFFYPTFLRWFKARPKLRIAFATLCAAGLGNFLYHFMRETHHFATKSVMEALAVFPSAVFYSLALAAGLILSQLNPRKAKPEDGFFAYHVLPRANVMLFFCFLKIFDDITGEGTLTERLAFTASLAGV